MSARYSELIQRLQSYRKAMNLSQSEMSDRLGVKQGHYSKIESGIKIISYQSLANFAESGGDISYLITGTHQIAGEMDEFMHQCHSMEQQKSLYELMSWAIRQGMKLEKNLFVKSLEMTDKYLCLLGNKESSGSIWFDIRKVENLTQAEFASGLDINVKRYRRIENLYSKPDAEILAKLYFEFHYSPLLIMQNQQIYLDEMNHVWNLFSNEVKNQLLNFIETGMVLISNEKE